MFVFHLSTQCTFTTSSLLCSVRFMFPGRISCANYLSCICSHERKESFFFYKYFVETTRRKANSTANGRKNTWARYMDVLLRRTFFYLLSSAHSFRRSSAEKFHLHTEHITINKKIKGNKEMVIGTLTHSVVTQ